MYKPQHLQAIATTCRVRIEQRESAQLQEIHNIEQSLANMQAVNAVTRNVNVPRLLVSG